MTQGRKSKTARVLGCLLVAVLALGAFAPAIALAQNGAEDEYGLDPNIPNPDETEQQSNANAGGGSAGGSTGGTGGGPTGSESTSAGGGASGPGDKADGGKDARDGGSGSNVSPASTAVPALNADSSDDGGAPVLLILLAAVAAVCTGVAVWRLRQSDPSERDTAQSAKPTPSAASETHSL